MNNMLKLVSLLTCLCLLLGSVAMADTYTATANGYGGQLTVEVLIDNGVITDVVLGENHETNVVMDRAFPVIRERIIAANTADVDSVSAATLFLRREVCRRGRDEAGRPRGSGRFHAECGEAGD